MRTIRAASHAVRAGQEAARIEPSTHRLNHGDWRRLAARIAQTDCAVLLTGETGVGKGFAARMIHEHSSRAKAPFVPVNCGAIPNALIDSHLFGHARGAFSGADREHPGLVRAADGGTLLLDEIADLPLTSQARLLRLLEEREVQPVGFSQPVKVNIRIIAATSADLQERVRQGAFRQDLLFRLDVVRLHLPALRERTHEIQAMLDQFNREFATLYRQPALEFSVEATRMIESCAWPGNVRELRTLVERLHVLCGRDAMFADCAPGADDDVRVITPEDLISHGGMRSGHSGVAAREAIAVGPAAIRLAELKLETVSHALSACEGNMSRAASSLGVHRSTLYRWLQSQQRRSA